MPRLTLVAAALVAAAATATPGAAAPERDTLIRPGVGIGKVRLGMTVAQVRRALGRQDTGWSEPRAFGRRYLELNWDRGRDDYTSVGFLGASSSLRAVVIGTTRPSERTSGGVGPGTTVSRLERVYPGARCRYVWPAGGGNIVRSEYVLSAPGGALTTFVVRKWNFRTEEDDIPRIVYVTVQSAAYVEDVRYERCAG